jgi:integrase
MATIIEVPSTAEGGKRAFRVQVRMKGRSESGTFPNRREALAWAASIETAIREGKHYPHAAAKRTTFDALVKDYTDSMLGEVSESEREARARHLQWWAKQFAGLTCSDVTSERISKARDALATETFTRAKTRTNKRTGVVTVPKEYRRTGATVNRFLGTLSTVLSFASSERHLFAHNPMRDTSRKKESQGRTRFLSDDERAKLLDACVTSDWPALHALVLLALTTGARRSEMMGLRWADVDLKTGRALLRKTKNGSQRTLVFASSKALEGLRALKLQNSARSQYVFRALNGLDEPYTYFDKHWYKALEAAGLKDFHFHDLRHSTASMLAAQGSSLLEIADVLGHKTLAMVQRYSHLVTDHKATVIAKMVAAKGL